MQDKTKQVKKGNFSRKGNRKGKNMSNKDMAYAVKHRNDEDCNDTNKINDFNDLSWYVVDEQILNDVARIPYSIPVGLPITRNPRFTHTPGTDDLNLSTYDSAMPGILVSNLMPTLGNAKNPDDPVNVAANSIYQFVRSKISGSRPYDAVDFMIYLGAMDSIFCICTWMTRLYATVFTYHQANRYLSRALIEAQDVDYDDFVSNLSKFRAGFNMRIAKIKSLFVPSNMSIFVRHAWMFSNYYIEGESEKDQIYMHKPAGCHKFKYDNDGAGMLEAYNLNGATNWGANPMTVQNMFNLLDSLLAPVYADEDFNRISGDLLKAYDGHVFTITEIPDIATVKLIHNEEVLLQFKNAKYAYVAPDGDRFTHGFFDYTQDTNKQYLQMNTHNDSLAYIHEIDKVENDHGTHVTSSSTGLQIAMLASKFSDFSKPQLLTSPHNDVVPGENMINTRLTLGFEIEADATSFWSGKLADKCFGTEWPVFYSIFTFRRRKSTGVIDLFQRRYTLSMFADLRDYTSARTLLESQLPVLSAFKYHPELFISIIGEDENNVLKCWNAGRSLFEVDNYAFVDFNLLTGLHNAAILGQYNVPGLSIGK